MALLEISGLRKVFGQVIANDHVDLKVEAGQTHAILGENGAGKSTLIKMISGLYRPDAGTIMFDGALRQFSNPREAIMAGIGVVHQHFMLIPALTVAENIVLGLNKAWRPYDRKAAEAQVRALSEQVGLPLDPTLKVENLPVGMQQRVEIVKALYRKAKLLVLDEPTAVLTPQETEDLFTVVHRLNDEGIPVIFISHKLEEVRAVAHRVTVMRAGKTVFEAPVGSASAEQLAHWMVGRDVVLQTKRGIVQTGDVVLQVKNLTVYDDRRTKKVDTVSFSVKQGEIFGLAGVDGNGQTELVEAITGLRKSASGFVHLQGTDISSWSVKKRIEQGIGYIPQDRQRDGLVLPFSIAENLQLREVSKAPFSRYGWLDKGAAKKHALKLVEEFDIRPRNVDLPVGDLSGGNQQKVILAREMARFPLLLVAVQPTRGLDVGAIEGIHKHLLSLRAKGRSILLVSLELDEILMLSDRIGVMHSGQLVAVYNNGEVTREELGLAMTGETATKEARA